MRLLAIDTATPQIVTGIVDTAGDPPVELAVSAHDGTNKHAEVLAPSVAAVSAQAGVALGDLDGIVVGLGPGPFTGLRVGIVTAAALGDALSIPVWGVCTLDAMAPVEGEALVVTDARRKEVYYARYYDGVRLGDAAVASPEVMAESAGATAVLHSGVAAYLSTFAAIGAVREVFPSPNSIVGAALRAGVIGGPPSVLQPLYIRRPDAAEPKAKPKLDVIGPGT